MKTRRLLSFVALASVTAGLLCLGPRPAVAEEDLGVENYHNAGWGTISYHQYQYPSTKSSFSFSPRSYVSFDIVNGKFFMLEHNRIDYEVHNAPGISQVLPFMSYTYPFALRYDALNVAFFTPDLKPLHSYEIVRPEHRYSIPKDGNDYERIICRLEYSDQKTDNASYKMRVWDEVDAVQAEPLEPGTDNYETYPVRR